MKLRSLALLATFAAVGCSQPDTTSAAPPPPKPGAAIAAKAPTPPPTPSGGHEEPAGGHGHGEHHEEEAAPPDAGRGHGSHEEEAAARPDAGKAPATLKEAAGMIEAAHLQLAGIVKDGDLSKAHVVADRLKALGATLRDLATKAGLGQDDVNALTLAGKKLGLVFREMDAAGDAGKREEAQKVFARYAEPVGTIKAKSEVAK